METTKKSNTSEQDILELVLNEILEQQKEANKINSGIIEALNHLSGKVSSFDEKLGNQTINVREPDTGPIKEIVEKGFKDANQILDLRLNKVRESNWRLFLQSDAKKWVVILLVAILFLTYLYLFATHLVNGR
jgi:hypothetical protein